MRVLLVLLLSTLTLFSYDERFTVEENSWIEKNPIVTYVGDPNWLPYEGYDSKGRYIGIVPELLELASKNSPLTFKHIYTDTWAQSIDTVIEDKVMMISQSRHSNSNTPLLFTQTFFKAPVVIIMQQGERYVSSLHQISEKKIGLWDNKTTNPILKKEYENIKFIDFKNVEDGLNSLALGEIDAFLCSLPLAGYSIAKKQFTNLRIVGKTEIEVELGFGVNQNHPILHNILNKMIANRSEESVQSVLSRWTRQQYIEKIDYTALYITLFVFTLISCIGIFAYLRIKRESQARIQAQMKMLLQQSKMASMGEMMDAVAHQWKQPLNALSMYSDLMKSDFEEGKIDEEYIDETIEGIQAQINHMINTLSEFRNFFRPNTKDVSFKLLDAIESVLLLVKDEFMQQSINIDINIDDAITIKGNENEFKHLVLNIINNAKDAFNERSVDKRTIIITARDKDDNLYIDIQDNAGGIPDSVIHNIFEANVTTKEAGKGTGIGLYMSMQIVKKMGGVMSVLNKNDGASFEIIIKRT